MKAFTAGEGRVWSLNYTPDGRSLVVQSGEPERPLDDPYEPVRVVGWWDWQRGTRQRSLEVNGPATFSPDHRLVVASAAGPAGFHLYDGRTLRRLRAVRMFAGEFAFSADNRVLVGVARPDGEDCEWSWEALAPRYHAEPAARPASAWGVTFSAGGVFSRAAGSARKSSSRRRMLATGRTD